MGEALWRPTAGRVAAANMTRYIDLVRRRFDRDVRDFASLYSWSVGQPQEFWPSIWQFGEIRAERSWDEVLVDADRMPGARWFTGARLNFARNLLRRADDHPAIVFRNEGGQRRSLSYAELSREVSRVARALADVGVEPGDRVAAFLPNVPEAVIAMLAATSLGAVWSSCSPDFGSSGVVDRFGQIEPKVLFAADGYCYNGKRIDSRERIRAIVERLPGLHATVVLPYLSERPDLSGLARAVRYEEFIASGADELRFASLPFDHPLYVLYSSGTTGVPKCIVHGAGGTLIQHLKELALHTDVRSEDRILYFTTCGWMMWNWLVSSLALGATVLLYDGSPTHPAPGALWEMASEERVTVFGTSAKYLAAIEKAGVRPGREHDLSALRTLLSTGSPLAGESFDYVYREIKQDLCLSSISGGTDIISCFALGNPIAPVYRGELQCRGLGMKVEVFNEQGRSVRGEKGELCCTKPFPSMPIRFWNDPGGERYRASYFVRFPGVWSHGDYAELTANDGVVIHGRSDTTLNPGGVRIGTAEIYRIVEKLPEIVESAVVGQNWEGDVRIVLFVVLRPGVSLDDDLRRRIVYRVRAETSPRHAPAKILEVPEIPRTISGKIVELAIRATIHGEPVKNTDALANPQALEHFRDRPELRTA